MNISDNIKPLVYVVIVNYNGAEWIDKCLNSLRNNSYKINVIIVDNASTDGSWDLIKNGYPEFDLINNHKNDGFGPGNNIGIAKALRCCADYVFLLNQDAWIEKDTIEKLIDTAEKNPEFGIISPIHLNDKKTAIDFGFVNYLSEKDCPGFLSDTYLKIQKPIYSIKFINAAGWLISKKCLQTVGGFDPLFFMYGEDFDYSHRVRFHNFKIGIIPQTTICHARSNHVGEETKRLSKREINNIISYDIAFLKNINVNFLFLLTIWVFRSGYQEFKYFASLEFKNSITLGLNKFKVIIWLPRILRSRSIDKNGGSLYFEIQKN